MEEILKLPFCIVVIHAIKSIKNLRKHVTIYFIWAPINNLLMLKGCKTCGPFKCLVSSQLAEISSKYLKKGGKVYVEGSLCTGSGKTKKWHRSRGNEIRADVLQLFGLFY